MRRPVLLLGLLAAAVLLIAALALLAGGGSLRPAAIAQGLGLITATPTATLTATATATATRTATPTPTHTPTPTVTPTATATATPTPFPDLFLSYTVEGLRQREFPGGAIEITNYWEETDNFTRYLIQYPSLDPPPGSGQALTISGMMAVPKGPGPFPVVILAHGSIPPSRFWSGADTYDASTYLASRGFLTISPDFRGLGRSDAGQDYFRSGWAIDIMNLISSLPSLPQADPARVGLWGHSMGGLAAARVMAVDDRIKAAVLYAPVTADDRELVRRRGLSGRPAYSDPLWSDYGQVGRHPDFIALTSPIEHLDFVAGPVQIHQGTADTTTPPRWAQAIRDALQEAGREVAYFSYQGQGHAFQGESWRLFMERIVEFFGRNLRG